MRLALVSDIHGNLIALDAVLADLKHESLDGGVSLGDVVGVGPRPRECVARLRELGWSCVLGNTDALVLDPQTYTGDAEAGQRYTEIDHWCAAQLGADERAALRAYPPTIAIPLDNEHNLLAYHGSPHSYDDRIDADSSTAVLDAYFDGTDALVYAGGHTHQPLLRRWRQAFVVNPGSVGLAFEYVPSAGEKRNRPHAEYAILDTSGRRIAIEFRRVPYDGVAVVHDAIAQGMPHAAWWGRHLSI